VLPTLHTQTAKVVFSYATVRNGPLTAFFLLGPGIGHSAHASSESPIASPTESVGSVRRNRRRVTNDRSAHASPRGSIASPAGPATGPVTKRRRIS